jgi:S1-C subfamily serine protease
MSVLRPGRVLAAAALAALSLGACGRDGPGLGDGAASTATVERTTRVEVLRDAPASDGATFDPQRIYRRALPGVVTILATGLGGDGDRAGVGSGFVVTPGGEVATNAHVITSGEGREIKGAREVFVRFEDGNQVPARIVGFDPFTDVGLLRVDPAGLELRPLPLGRAADLRVGEPVAAIGSPFGEQGSLSVGVISALDRSIQSLTGFATTGAIQTDAAINRGNSGGPLLDAGGRVLGVNSQIETSSGDGSGVGFAVAVDTVRRSLAQLRRGGIPRYAYLGVGAATVYPQLAERFGLGTDTGAWLQEVTPGGPGAAAGLRGGTGSTRFQARPYATGGDVIVAVDGRPVRRDSDLAALVSRRAPGTTVTLTIVRDGKRREVRARLGERPLETPSAR